MKKKNKLIEDFKIKIKQKASYSMGNIILIMVACVFLAVIGTILIMDKNNYDSEKLERQNKIDAQARYELLQHDSGILWEQVSRWSAIYIIEYHRSIFTLGLVLIGASWIIHGIGFRFA